MKTDIFSVHVDIFLPIYTESKNDPFSFEHKFGKCSPILIILSLLQTEINQAYPKISHHTSNLLVHYLVKQTRMYWPSLLACFRS